jgi:hypothetical protein
MLTRREFYFRLVFGAVAAIAWWVGGSIYLDSIGWSYGAILLIDVAATGVLVRLLGVYPEPYDRYKAQYLARSEDSRADSQVQIGPPAP